MFIPPTCTESSQFEAVLSDGEVVIATDVIPQAVITAFASDCSPNGSVPGLKRYKFVYVIDTTTKHTGNK